jgi:superfamily II DNA or RNA helicase
MPKGWYEQFGCVFGDEAHGCAAKSLISILSSCREARYRFGTTGTLTEEPLSEANIIGLFGPKLKTISTKELMDQGYVANLKINCIVLNYPKEDRKAVKNLDYPDEIKFLINHQKRNEILVNLVKNLKGNNLIFFRMKDHGQILFNAIQEQIPDKKLFYIDGGVKGTDREEIRNTMETVDGANLVASLGTTSTGISVKKLNNMIAAHPGKSKIKVMQSIGRMLRLNDEKKITGAVLFDIVDNLSIGQYKNYTLNHFIVRTKMYDAENFDYKIINMEIE